MSPPIRDGSGSSIDSIRLGDGSEIAEVRTGAGDVLFSASTIPDSITNRLKMDEGSGSTLNDSIGAITATFLGTWLNASRFTGGTATQYDATDENWTTDSNININGQSWGVGFWITDVSNPADFGGLIASYPPNIQPNNGWAVFLGDTGSGSSEATDTLTVRHRNNGGINDAISNLSIPDLGDGDDYFVGVSGNGDTTSIYIWDESQQLTSTSGTGIRGQTADAPLTGMDRAGSSLDGVMDDVHIAQGNVITESEFEQIRNDTNR